MPDRKLRPGCGDAGERSPLRPLSLLAVFVGVITLISRDTFTSLGLSCGVHAPAGGLIRLWRAGLAKVRFAWLLSC